jgi:hypothetical protein
MIASFDGALVWVGASVVWQDALAFFANFSESKEAGFPCKLLICKIQKLKAIKVNFHICCKLQSPLNALEEIFTIWLKEKSLCKRIRQKIICRKDLHSNETWNSFKCIIWYNFNLVFSKISRLISIGQDSKIKLFTAELKNLDFELFLWSIFRLDYCLKGLWNLMI